MLSGHRHWHTTNCNPALEPGDLGLTWLMEFAVQEARPVPRDDTKNIMGSKVTGAIAKPAAAVVTTRAVTTETQSKVSQTQWTLTASSAAASPATISPLDFGTNQLSGNFGTCRENMQKREHLNHLQACT